MPQLIQAGQVCTKVVAGMLRIAQDRAAKAADGCDVEVCSESNSVP